MGFKGRPKAVYFFAGRHTYQLSSRCIGSQMGHEVMRDMPKYLVIMPRLFVHFDQYQPSLQLTKSSVGDYATYGIMPFDVLLYIVVVRFLTPTS